MKKDDAKLTKALVEAIIGLFPGGLQAKAFASPLLDRALLNGISEAPTIESIIVKKSQEIAGSILLLETAERTHPGWRGAVGDDLIAVLGRANVTPRLLVELQLDTDLFFTYLKDIAEPELRIASVGRRERTVEGLRRIAEAILEIAPDLSGVRLAFMREMLKRLPSR